MVGSVRLNPGVSSSFEDGEARGPIYREAEETPRRVFPLTTNSPSILTLRSRSILTSLPLTARQQQAQALVEDILDFATRPSTAALIIGGGALLGSARIAGISTELNLVSALSTSTISLGLRWATSLAAAPAVLFLGGCGENSYEEPPTPVIPDPTPPPDYPDAGSPDSGTPPQFLMERVSVGIGGIQANGPSRNSSVSGGGSYIAFESDASNLVSDDTNGFRDIFVRDRINGITEIISRAIDGAQANGNSRLPSISSDGRYVIFESDASNLVPGDTNGTTDVFLMDRNTGNLQKISGSAGGSFPAISPNGLYYTYRSPTGSVGGFPGNATFIGTPDRPSLSDSDIVDSGSRLIAFSSNATDLLYSYPSPGILNGYRHIFANSPGSSSLISMIDSGDYSSADQQSNGDSRNPSISGNGLYVAYQSAGDNNYSFNDGISDTNHAEDISLGRPHCIGGLSGWCRSLISRKGDQVGNGRSFSPSLNWWGDRIAFASEATNLAENFGIGFDNNGVSDIIAGRILFQPVVTPRLFDVTVNEMGHLANGPSYEPHISSSGSFVSFTSEATNLVSGDTNGVADIFLVGLDYFLPAW